MDIFEKGLMKIELTLDLNGDGLLYNNWTYTTV